MTDAAWEVVATYSALWEAELAAGRLASSGILHRIDQRGSVGLFGAGYAGTTVTGIALEVPIVQLDAAREALE